MFKVGDRGKTRGGFEYEVIDDNCVTFHAGRRQPIRAEIYCGEIARGTFYPDGRYFSDSEDEYDLMPPDNRAPQSSDYTPATWQQAVKDFALLLIEGYNAPDAQQIARAALDFTGDEE